MIVLGRLSRAGHSEWITVSIALNEVREGQGDAKVTREPGRCVAATAAMSYSRDR